MKPIALFFVVTATLIEAIGFGWMAVELWPDMVLVAVAIGALLICLPVNFFAGWVIDRRLRQIEADQEGPRSAAARSSVIDRT
jgi:hypothetical protein